MKNGQTPNPPKEAAEGKTPLPTPAKLSSRVDFAKRVEKTLVASSSSKDEEALEAFEKTRAELLSELNEEELADLAAMRKNESVTALLRKKVSEWEKKQAAMAPGGESDDWEDLEGFDYDALNSEEYEALTDDIEAGYEKLEELEREKKELARKGHWRAKACFWLEKAVDRFKRKYAQLKDYEAFGYEALPDELRKILENNPHRAVRSAFSVTFILKTKNGIPEKCLWGHYRDTPFSWSAFQSKKDGAEGSRETFLHESRHNAYEALFEESDFREDLAILWYRLQSLEKIGKSNFPEPMKKERYAFLVRSIRSMAKTFAEKFLSHNRDEVLANFWPLMNFQGSTEVANADDIHLGLKMVRDGLEDGTQAKKEAAKLLERYEEEVSDYFDRLSDFLFVARMGSKPQTAKMLVYVTEPYEFELAETHLEQIVGIAAYDAFSKLRRMLYPKGIRHSVPRKNDAGIQEKDFASLLKFFRNVRAWDPKRRFKNHPGIPKIASEIEKRYSDEKWKAESSMTPEDQLLNAIFGRSPEKIRNDALELAKLMREYVE